MNDRDQNYIQGRPDGAEPAAKQATLREFLAVLFRRRWIVLGLFAVTTLTVMTVAATTPVLLISSGSVLVKRGEKESLLNPYRRVTGNWEEDLASEMEIVRSKTVLDRARAILAAEAAGEETLAVNPRQLEVEVTGKSAVLAIGYVDAQGHVAERVCDAIIRAYVEFRQTDFALAYPRAFFESELSQVESDLAGWTERRREFASRAGMIEVEEQNRQLIAQLGVLKQRKSEAQENLAEAQSAQASMEALTDDPSVDLPTFSALYSNETALIELKRKLLDQEARLVSLRERLRDEAPEVENAKMTIESLKAMLRREVEARVSMSANRIEIIASRLAVIDRDIASLTSELESMPTKQSRLSMMDREIEVLKQRYEDLTEKSDQALVTEQTSVSVNVLLLTPAGSARAHNARDYVRLALAPAFSIVVGIGLAFFIDGLDLTVRTSGQAEEALRLPVLASLNERRRKSSPQ